MLTQSQISIIKKTVPVLEQHGTDITGVFYNNMFDAHPELLNIFNKTNQKQGHQKTALAMTVLAAAKNIENLSVLLPQVTQIAHKHRALNILPEHYPIVGKYLLGAIKQVLGKLATDDIIDAWRAAYQEIADVFIQVESTMYQQADWSVFIRVTVRDKQLTGTDICHFSVVSDEIDFSKLTLKAGQYLTVKAHPNSSNNDALRHYSLCSVSTENGLQFAVRRDNRNGHRGLVSNYLHDEIQVDDELFITAPAGDFTLNGELITQSQTPLVFISAGVGITPVLAMLEQQVMNNPHRPIVWIYACQDKAHKPFSEQLQNLLDKAEQVQTHYFYSDGDVSGEAGRIDATFLQKLPKPADVYICGSMAFMQTMVKHLATLEHNADYVHYEPFGPKMSL